MRVALGLEYDGAHFCGWQSQPGGCGVQDALERELARMACHPVRVIAAGRTDTGVHALVQVVHFETMTDRPLSAWVRGVNAGLPPSVRVLWAQQMADDFHARFSARQRYYQYLLFDQAVAPAILAGKVGWFHQPLDVAAMAEAATHLIGEHDFSAFRAAECQAKSPIRTLQQAEVCREGQAILFEFSGNAFLHHQVRNMVGALVYVGKGSQPPVFIHELLQSKDRRLAPPTFSPDGLYLSGVGYESRWGLPDTRRFVHLSLA
ncbi:tRNA pseudouridine(38-40) synthase TruA [Methylovorus menthalis]|uniref:tRNA pseudouridine(38-40) synthase TruA n=1 Tax=Methylovorus menthalis TaxID=1002227 RepID=UPI001E3B0778|nr:tRNA pseudouridine(38-40) synthase TruA [Methylovorus menthalis]MCB4811559.1 tRNA pseudouridine(38-40) synthase TruA [Methylovorus menthalis]